MFEIIAIPAFKDNYIWAIITPNFTKITVVDPGDAEPVLEYCEKNSLEVGQILITHHHWDHSGGIAQLLKKYPDISVIGPKKEKIAGVNLAVEEGDKITLINNNQRLSILDIPAHTKGHIAYFGSGVLFCGDTLFAMGCGRLFEGTAQEMLDSLTKLASLPDATQVYCGHEYTLDNARFSLTIEPHNFALKERYDQVKNLRIQKKITLPTTIGIEKATNPFLRCKNQEVTGVSVQVNPKKNLKAVEIFANLRAKKDNFT